MISFLRGTIFYIGHDNLIIDVGGVGYQVAVNPKEIPLLKKGEKAFIYTSFILREDMVQLFGFLTFEGLKLFRTLILASGIGPKTALAITGSISYREFACAVLQDDLRALMCLPGVGKKTAQKMLLELKDKIPQEDISAAAPSGTLAAPGIIEAREALRGLGFVAGEVEELLSEALKEKGADAESDVLVKHVLQQLGGRRSDNGTR